MMKKEKFIQENEAPNQSYREKIKIILMIIVVILLLPVFSVNLTLIIKGSIDRSVPPAIFGYAPLAVTTGSMNGDKTDSFDEGTLIFVKLLDEAGIRQLTEGDIITFRTDDGYVTHRIVTVIRDSEEYAVSFVTQGDANNTTDGAIPVANVIGKCVGSIGGLGDFALFMQTPAGILVFAGIPVVLFILYDVVRIALNNQRIKEEKELAEKEEELRRLRSFVESRAAEQCSSEKECEKQPSNETDENKQC